MKIKINNKGFSLIELMATIAILGLIAGITIAGYRSGNKSSILKNAANKLQSDIRLAQNYTLGSYMFFDGTDNIIPERGWGVHFSMLNTSNSSYIIFADNDSGAVDFQFDGSSEQYREISLAQGVIISDIFLNGISVSGSGGMADIVFDPPDPKAFFNGNPNVDAEIILSDSATSQQYKISVNAFGLIETEKN
jgi:prepilin-type N-terminal cleavage/methylation domain-containing protein